MSVQARGLAPPLLASLPPHLTEWACACNTVNMFINVVYRSRRGHALPFKWSQDGILSYKHRLLFLFSYRKLFFLPKLIMLSVSEYLNSCSTLVASPTAFSRKSVVYVLLWKIAYFYINKRKSKIFRFLELFSIWCPTNNSSKCTQAIFSVIYSINTVMFYFLLEELHSGLYFSSNSTKIVIFGWKLTKKICCCHLTWLTGGVWP